MINKILSQFSYLNLKHKYIRKYFDKNPFSILEIGAGNHSASKTKKLFLNCEYHGLDLDKSYNNDENDFKACHAFYEIDLTTLNYKIIPDNYFDFIRMAHVIEHLPNGEQVIVNLLPKLKRGGYFYLEYPGKKSLNLPSMYGTLNFQDDPTHVKVYNYTDLSVLFEENECTVILAKTRRNIWNILAMPARILISMIRNRKMEGNIFWDITGFAEFILAKKDK